uniref:Uncharacterized protein n=1 Tax=Knipowitschia caucasica TaxID=637954 RepID=A0AAV2MQQ6_KNICA
MFSKDIPQHRSSPTARQQWARVVGSCLLWKRLETVEGVGGVQGVLPMAKCEGSESADRAGGALTDGSEAGLYGHTSLRGGDGVGLVNVGLPSRLTSRSISLGSGTEEGSETDLCSRRGEVGENR